MAKTKRYILAAILLLALLLLTACGGPESTYKSAQDLLSKGKYTEAAEKFESLGSYEDATTLTMYCKACALCESGNYETGIKALKQMGDYKDCAYRITYYNARAYEDEAGTDNWEYMLEAKAIYNTIPLFLDSSDRITALDARVEAAKIAYYNKAVETAESGDYATARSMFWILDSYSDSESRIAYYDIRKEEDNLAETTDQDALIAVATHYTEMGEYLDCAERAAALIARADEIVAARYAEVAALTEEGKYAEAIAILDTFGTYGNEQVSANCYAIGEKYRADSQWSAASAAYAKAGKYSDAVNLSTYCALRKEEDQLADTTDQNAVDALATRYADLGDCLDCADRATALNARAAAIFDSKYEAAVALMNEGKYNEAITAFTAIKSHKDSAAQITACETVILDGKYDAAVALMNEGKYLEAYESFVSLNGHKDSKAKANTILQEYPMFGVSVGSYLTFGTYEQDNNTANGKESIEWRVLAKENNRLLVISRYALDAKPYNKEDTDVTWETCTLRKWLNNVFLNAAFSSTEKAMIPTVTVSADENPWYASRTDPGNATQDKVFLLSVPEVQKYFADDRARRCMATAYAQKQGVDMYSIYCYWWLRSPGRYQGWVAYVDNEGNDDMKGQSNDDDDVAVRPALWINLEP